MEVVGLVWEEFSVWAWAGEFVSGLEVFDVDWYGLSGLTLAKEEGEEIIPWGDD